MTDITATTIARGGEPGLGPLVIAGLRWAHEAIRAFKTVARKGRLTDEAAVRSIATRADALCLSR